MSDTDTTPDVPSYLPEIVAGTNSYASLENANDLVFSRLFTTAWTSTDLAFRAQALVTATALLDRMRWQGRKLAPTQPLAWPRVPQGCPQGYPLSVEIPTEIITATVELAVHLLATGKLPGGPAVQQQMLGDASVMHFAYVADDLPRHVRQLIAPFLRVASVNVAEVTF